MNKYLLILSFAIGFLSHSTQVHSETRVFDGIAAVVDDDVILHSELERRMDVFRLQIKSKKGTLPEETVFKQQVMEQLVVESLQIQIARRMGVRISDAELNATIGNIARQNKKTEEEFREQLQAEGTNYTLFREDLRKEIMLNRVRQAQVRRRVNMSEQEVETLVALMDEEGATNSLYHIGHIMISISESSAPADISAAREKANNIVKRLRDGAEFSPLAIAESDGREALKGGDFGWKSLAELPTLFSGTVKNLKVESISDPLRSASGFHIIKLLGKQGGVEQKLVEQVHCRHILIKPSKIITEAQAQDKLKEIKQSVAEGKDFAEFARLHSEDLGSASDGGNIDWSDPSIFAPEFKQQLLTLEVNQTSEPFKTQFGWHIVELLGKRTTDKTEEQKLNKARQTLFARKFDEEVNNWLREIRSEAVVQILDNE